MSIENPKHPERAELNDASALLPHFPRLRAIREHYSQLEIAKYGQSWGKLELLDGTKGDIGDLSKLETGRRGLRDGYSHEAAAHEVVDCAWSLVVSADSNMIDPVQACEEADRRGVLIGASRQFINRLSLAVAHIDEMVDPPQEPLFGYAPDDREALLVGYYAEGFRAVFALAEAYDMNLPQAIVQNMDLLEQRIHSELE
jgi:hypothetical protein